MTSANALTPLDPTDYNAIEAAVMETARGRWFLAEYAKRNRNADTDMLLSAIGRLEEAVSGERTSQDLDRLRFDLMEMAKSIARTKSEIAALRPNGDGVTQLEEATEALDAIVRTTERATSEILESAETIQETAWTLRERDVDDSLCDILDRRATDIYTACSFQDLTAQRISKVVHVMRYLEGRINAMIDIWGGADGYASAQDMTQSDSADAPLSGIDMSMTQSDIDDVIVDEALFETAYPDGMSYDPSPRRDRHATVSPLINDGDIMFAEEHPHLAAVVMPAEPEPLPTSVLAMNAEAEISGLDDPQNDSMLFDHMPSAVNETPAIGNPEISMSRAEMVPSEGRPASMSSAGLPVEAEPVVGAVSADIALMAMHDTVTTPPPATVAAEEKPEIAQALTSSSPVRESTMEEPSLVEDVANPDLVRRRAFAEIDAMSAAEKLRHFT